MEALCVGVKVSVWCGYSRSGNILYASKSASSSGDLTETKLLSSSALFLVLVGLDLEEEELVSYQSSSVTVLADCLNTGEAGTYLDQSSLPLDFQCRFHHHQHAAPGHSFSVARHPYSWTGPRACGIARGRMTKSLPYCDTAGKFVACGVTRNTWVCGGRGIPRYVTDVGWVM